MKRDAHYYAILALSKSIGFEKIIAHKNAYASQFVDDARANLITFSDNNNPALLKQFSDTPPLFNAATAHSYFEINTLSYAAMVNNTTAFHFVPGCDGKTFLKKCFVKKNLRLYLIYYQKQKLVMIL